MKAYLVWVPSRGQSDFESSIRQFLETAPAIFIASEAKQNAQELFARLHDSELTSADSLQAKHLAEEIESKAPTLTFEPNTQVELRFRDLNYNLIWQLQRDELVDVSLTPQRRASICIVLGTLGRFAGQSAGLPP